ncbi:MAG: glycosyltransferase family 2 protein [Propionivibrio sp.]|nr:glycosyltransferase family 2 protein [Propionivibrio sp.]
MGASYSVIIPARNEATNLERMIPEISTLLPEVEIIVVDDGSIDETEAICLKHNIRLLRHKYQIGNGAAIKTGARAASGDILIFMDGDGQHKPSDIPLLLDAFSKGFDMVVGARQSGSHAGSHRALANDVFSRFASWMVGQHIEDLTSGFRIVHATKFRQYLYLLPNGFSYPTTITMSYFRAGLSVSYFPIHTPRRISGMSHIHPIKDGLRFLLIIFKIGTLYSPLKLFLPISISFFFTGIGHYIYTYLTQHRFTNMSALLFTSSVLIFLIGLISEQITMLIYRDSDR